MFFRRTNTFISFLTTVALLLPAPGFSDPLRTTISVKPKGKLASTFTKHIGANFETPEQLIKFVKELRLVEKYGDQPLAIRWISPVEKTPSEMLALSDLLPDDVYLDFIVLEDSAADEYVPSKNEKIQEKARILRRNWVQNSKSFWGRLKNFKGKKSYQTSEYLAQKENKASLGVGLTKATLGLVVWSWTGMADAEAAYLATLAISSSLVLDVGFQALANTYAEFKRDHKLLFSKSLTKIGLGRAVAYYNARPSLKAFVVDNIVGVTVSAYFAAIRHFQDPKNGPPWERQWLSSYFIGNIIGAIFGASADMAALSLAEKEILNSKTSQLLKWIYFQARGLSFWSKNTLIAVGVLRGADSPVLQTWAILELGLYASLVGANWLLKPRTAEGRKLANLLPKLRPGINITAFEPDLQGGALKRLKILSGFSGETSLNEENHLDPVTGDIIKVGTVDWPILIKRFELEGCNPSDFAVSN